MLKNSLVVLTVLVNDDGLYVKVPKVHPARTEVLMDDTDAQLHAESASLGWGDPQCMLAERKLRKQVDAMIRKAEKHKPNGSVRIFCRTEKVSRFNP